MRNQMAAENLDRCATASRLVRGGARRASRMSRADLVRIANMYFSGIERNDGKGVYPISKTCARLENGSVTAGDPAIVLGDAPPVGATPVRRAARAVCSSFNPASSSTSRAFAIDDSWPSIRNAASLSRLPSSTTRPATRAMARWPTGARSFRVRRALDLADRRSVQDRKRRDRPGRIGPAPSALRHGLRLEQLGRCHVEHDRAGSRASTPASQRTESDGHRGTPASASRVLKSLPNLRSVRRLPGPYRPWRVGPEDGASRDRPDVGGAGGKLKVKGQRMRLTSVYSGVTFLPCRRFV